ncbi:MAG: VWA domain-containing protein, partial [Opitutus sp.]|nr:VWA domain-containing protein [Opitutus sp.]
RSGGGARRVYEKIYGARRGLARHLPEARHQLSSDLHRAAAGNRAVWFPATTHAARPDVSPCAEWRRRMSFLTPLFLLGGLAIVGPILYHLVRRTTREKTLFSSLMFLLPSPPRLSQRHRLEHILLLILRCLALALLALGFARPFMRQSPIDDPTVAQPKRLVVLIDISASMRRDGLWAAARSRVEDVLRRAGPADQVAIFPFDKQAVPLVPFEDWNRTAPGDRVAFALGRVGAISPGWAGTHLGNALVTAAEALGESDDGKAAPGPRQIVLVSDLQAGSRLDALQAYEWPKGVDLVVESVKARNPTNAGVQLVADGPESNRAFDAPVRVRVTNAADSKREQFKLGWTRSAAGQSTGANPAAEYVGTPIEAYVPPGQSRVFSVPVTKGGPILDQITLRGDDEEFDNTVFFIPSAQQRATVLWIGQDVAEDAKQPLFFLRRALAETPRVLVQVVAVAPSAPLLPTDVAAASVIFISDAVSTATATALREQALAGRTIVFMPKRADAAHGAMLGALLGREAVRIDEAKPANYAMFSEIDFQHPLFAPFADPRYSDFTKIHFWKYRKIDAAAIPGARIVAKFDAGDPALMEVPVGKGRLYVLASGWQPEDSQLAVSSKFVPLIWSLLEQTGGVASFATQFSVGDAVPLPAELAATGVRAPGGTDALPVAMGAPFALTAQPGIYEVNGGVRVLRFAVNLDANESRTTPLGPDELEQLGVPIARAKTVAQVPSDKKSVLQGLEAENRQKLWRWFIAATLAVLLMESALAGWTARRSATQTEEAA